MSYDFADRLIEMRRSRGLSQEELAKRLGLSRQAISKWERAESSPDIGNLIALAEIYEVTLDELIGTSSSQQGDGGIRIGEPTTASEGAVCEYAPVEDNATDAAEEEFPASNAAMEAIAPAMPCDSAALADSSPSANLADSGLEAEPQQGFLILPPPHGAEPTIPAAPTMDLAATQAAGQGQGIPQEPVTGIKPKRPLLTFPYPLLVALIYLVLGFCFHLWHPGWVVFFTIPFYYWIASVVAHDPEYAARHGIRAD